MFQERPVPSECARVTSVYTLRSGVSLFGQGEAVALMVEWLLSVHMDLLPPDAPLTFFVAYERELCLLCRSKRKLSGRCLLPLQRRACSFGILRFPYVLAARLGFPLAI